MLNTMDLLDKALQIKNGSKWSEALELDVSTLYQAKKRGRLSPTLAGFFAMELGESPEHWIAIAAIEAEKTSPLLERLKRSQPSWRKLLLMSNNKKARLARALCILERERLNSPLFCFLQSIQNAAQNRKTNQIQHCHKAARAPRLVEPENL